MKRLFFKSRPRTSKEAQEMAIHIIKTVVNDNTKGIRMELKDEGDGLIIWNRQYSALIEAIWLMVGDMAIITREGNDRLYLRRCEWCNTPFKATHKRQRFCPPDIGNQSLCGLKYRQHRFKAKGKS